MVFSSALFLFLFLPVFWAVYMLAGRFRNLALLVFSLLFYFIGEGVFLLVMLASIGLNYGIGRAMAQSPNRRRFWLWGGLIGNLAPLIFFKYIEFIAYDVLGLPASAIGHGVHLPIGISFFTFQGMSYLIDVYRGTSQVERSLTRLATYIAMFPQLIAGPIVRFASISDQLVRRVTSARYIYFGALFFAVGLAQKVLIADTLAVCVDEIFAQPPESLHASAVWLGGVAYTFQIYFDFSGYSAMAIGLGLVLGFELPRNFNFPYIARSITEFWRRWHLTLSGWFRDYLYIPLGGNRMGAWRTYRNLVVVFLLTGLWHGAAWNFLLWGIWHGSFMLVERLGEGAQLKRLWSGAQIAYALLAVYVGWILFRAPDLNYAIVFAARHVTGWQDGRPGSAFMGPELMATLIAAIVLSVPLVLAGSRALMATADYGAWRRPHPLWKYGIGALIAGLLFGLAAMKVLSGAYSPFIYFRF